MDEEPTESVDSDQPRYQLRNRTTAVSSSSSQVLITSRANLPAIGAVSYTHLTLPTIYSV